MAVIRDVMPAFELYQPGSVADAQKLLAQHGPDAWVLAGGLDSFDWLKDRIKKPKVVVDLSGIEELRGVRTTAEGHRDRRHDHADRSGESSHHQAEVRSAGAGRGAGGIAANPQPGNDRRQCFAGHALLVLPWRLALLPRRRQHLLCRYSEGRNREHAILHADRCVAVNPSDTAPGADCARRQDGPAHDPRRARRGCRGLLSSVPDIDITRMHILAAWAILLTAIRIPSTWASAQFYFEKIRDRNVWDFPLMNVASAMVSFRRTPSIAYDRGERRCRASAAAESGRRRRSRQAAERCNC